ncbi:MAG: tRNA pseudouridine(38-40) synthase TruA [Pirellulaceae bacterium]
MGQLKFNTALPCFRITLAYDGTAYAGWQFQPGLPTIQGTLEEALQRIVGASIRITASGRTDAGVHAQAQVASFRCDTRLTPEVLRRALNAHTPPDIHVSEVRWAPDEFHARRDAVGKRYRYVIQDGPGRDVFCRTTAWHMPRVLDVPRMQAGAAFLVGRHDFRSFEAAGAPRRTSVRTIQDLHLERFERHALQPLAIDVEADGFLYNMVRNIVGSLVVVGRGDEPPDWIGRVLAAQDRSCAGPTAPACGLMLLYVRYTW